MDNNVISLETAKKLKAAGFPQKSDYWFWLEDDGSADLVDHKSSLSWVNDVAAPAAQEIADELDKGIVIQRYHGGNFMPANRWSARVASTKRPHSISGEFADTMAEALAALWLALKENNNAK